MTMEWTLPFDGIDVEFGDGYGAGDFAGEFDFDGAGDVTQVRLRITRIGPARKVQARLVTLARGSWLEHRLAEAIAASTSYRDQMQAVIEEEAPQRRDVFVVRTQAGREP